MISLRAEDGAPRLDRFLADRFPEIPRARWDVHVRTGEIKVNGQAVTKGGVKLRPGDLVETELPLIAVPAAHLEAEDIDLPTLYEDGQLWIVDKPTGMVVHPGPGHADPARPAGHRGAAAGVRLRTGHRQGPGRRPAAQPGQVRHGRVALAVERHR